MFAIKKVLFFAVICVTFIFGAFIFDYIYNEKSVKVSIYTVSPKDIQKNFTLNGEIEKQGNVNMLVGFSKDVPEIAKGASATIVINEKKYDGFLYEVSTLTESLYKVKISIMTKDDISGKGVATIIGVLQRNVIVVPYSCIFTDEQGKDAIMVENQGFAVKRNVTLGKLNNQDGTEVLDGLCQDEKIIFSPQNLKTGDKVGSIE